jgi:hypothetical protein
VKDGLWDFNSSKAQRMRKAWEWVRLWRVGIVVCGGKVFGGVVDVVVLVDG